jgi:hypothetical protein
MNTNSDINIGTKNCVKYIPKKDPQDDIEFGVYSKLLVHVIGPVYFEEKYEKLPEYFKNDYIISLHSHINKELQMIHEMTNS